VTHHRLTKEQVEDYAKRIERGFNERDPRLIEELLSPHLVDHNRLLGGVDLRQRMARVLEAVEDARYSVEEVIVEGNAVAWRWSITGTHTNPIMGVTPTGKAITISGLSAAVLKDGKVMEHWEFSDDQSVLAQLEESVAG
jgi:predicted ester cyclase